MDAAIEAFQKQKVIRHENLTWLLVAQAVVILPLLLRLPIWLWLVWAGVTFWRWRIFLGRQAYPSGIVKGGLGVACVAGLVVSYNGHVGMESMIGFLVCAFMLKVLELHTRKDGLLMLFIGFIAVATQFLFAQTALVALYAIFSCVTLIVAWHTIYATRSLTTRSKLLSGATLIMHAMPLMVILFVVMPRLGPLWQVPLPQTVGSTGFSETLSPGDLGRLVQSEGTAFRVTFTDSTPPAPVNFYWRGLALDYFDGRTWHLDQRWDRQPAHKVPATSLPKDSLSQYDIMLEPHQYRWLFSLSAPIDVKAVKPRAKITGAGLIVADQPVSTRMQYSAVSVQAADYPWKPLPSKARQRLTTIPERSNPEAVRLAGRWVLEGLSTQQKVDAALSLYRQSFYYTLEPPVLGDHSVDAFLFDTQRGFCEHFASSFTFLMRAANVPARVVVGYHGGTYNTLEDYWRIAQSDAHAWSEVWFEKRGWVRVDPTAAVAPERIEQGLSQALPSNERERVAGGLSRAPQWLVNIRQRFDAAGYAWNRWVLAYNDTQQEALFKKLLGGTDPWRVGLAFMGGVGLLFAAYMLFVIRPQYQRPTALQKAIKRFDRVCERLGYAREPDESLAVFSRRLGKGHPTVKPMCEQVARLSEDALYAGGDTAHQTLINTLNRFPKP